MRELDEEILGGEEEDDQPDVQGNQAPVDWSREPLSDEGLSPEARAKVRPALLP